MTFVTFQIYFCVFSRILTFVSRFFGRNLSESEINFGYQVGQEKSHDLSIKSIRLKNKNP